MEAIVDRYTYWPDASDEHAVRREFIHVCCFNSVYVFIHIH